MREQRTFAGRSPLLIIDQIALIAMFEHMEGRGVPAKPWWQTVFHYLFREILGL